MAKHVRPDAAADEGAPVPLFEATPLPDGTTLLTPRDASRSLPLTREEWRVPAGSIEVRQLLLGIRRVRRYRDGALWLEHRRRGAEWNRALVLRAGGQLNVLASGDEAQLRALGALIAQRTGWRFRISQAPPP